MVGGSSADSIGDWRAAVAPYVGADRQRSITQVVTTLALLAATFAAMYRLLGWSIWGALTLALPAAGLLVRTFAIMHDCAHGSFLRRRRVNDATGYITAVLTLTPYTQWRRDHALHHASAGDLERRGKGDVPLMTLREYLGSSAWARLMYRTIRHPASLLLVG